MDLNANLFCWLRYAYILITTYCYWHFFRTAFYFKLLSVFLKAVCSLLGQWEGEMEQEGDFIYFRFFIHKVIRDIFMLLWDLFQNVQEHLSWLTDLRNCSFVLKYVIETWFNIIRNKTGPEGHPSTLSRRNSMPRAVSLQKWMCSPPQSMPHSFLSHIRGKKMYLFLMRVQF